MRSLLAVLVLIVAGAAAFLAWPRLEGEPPELTAPNVGESGALALGAGGAEIELGWSDARSGLRHVEAFLEMDTGARPLLTRSLHERHFLGNLLAGPTAPARTETARVTLDPKELGLPDGDGELVLRARDWSWREGLQGNSAELRVPIRVDTRPPEVSVESGLTYVRRGGSAAVVYSVNDAARDGVRVGDAFFPGTRLDARRRVSVFAIPIDAEERPSLRVVAIDEAGNEASARFDARLQERQFPEVSINLSSAFLEGVARDLGAQHELSAATPVATFQRVNKELRADSEARIQLAIGKVTPRRWRGAFEQMYNSRVTSQFAELRTYLVDGEHVSTARHYGYDLASTSHAPITASNDGIVLLAEEVGIYGRLVLIDHGLGITTLYGHLTDIDVKPGDEVLKGQEIGRSGATGLAGGDHLHFAILVGHTYVDPVEWWDPKWVREHIDVRLDEQPLAQAGSEP